MTRRLETRTSRTAEWTCLSRAASYAETDVRYKSGDWVAPLILPELFRPIVGIGFARRIFIRTFFPKGIYKYVIARTKFIDQVFDQAMRDGFAQILMMGAGFDSRAIRLPSRDGKTKVFELDAPITQQAKIGQYQQRKISVPANLIFVPIDFERQTLSQRLTEVGFRKDCATLFVLEGLTMYLEPESIAQTFTVISEYAGKGSRVVFDYVLASVLRGEALCYGESEIRETVNQAGEQWRFGIEQGAVGTFLKPYSFKLVEHQDAGDLENRYFRTAEGMITDPMNSTHCIAVGERE
jgi:methyltransferase (TIGR00027 family)